MLCTRLLRFLHGGSSRAGAAGGDGGGAPWADGISRLNLADLRLPCGGAGPGWGPAPSAGGAAAWALAEAAHAASAGKQNISIIYCMKLNIMHVCTCKNFFVFPFRDTTGVWRNSQRRSWKREGGRQG